MSDLVFENVEIKRVACTLRLFSVFMHGRCATVAEMRVGNNLPGALTCGRENSEFS